MTSTLLSTFSVVFVCLCSRKSWDISCPDRDGGPNPGKIQGIPGWLAAMHHVRVLRQGPKLLFSLGVFLAIEKTFAYATAIALYKMTGCISSFE